MSKKIISIGLSEQEIDRTIKELETYKREFSRKVDVFREKVAARMANEAQSGFNGAVVDDLVKGGQKIADVHVTFDRGRSNSVTVVVTSGKDAVWVEFGAGVYHNSTAGTSPHPRGAELGFTIGGFGKGKGKREIWGYKGEDEDTITLTRGTPAKMPMERAFLSVCNEITEIAREVFG